MRVAVVPCHLVLRILSFSTFNVQYNAINRDAAEVFIGWNRRFSDLKREVDRSDASARADESVGEE